MTNDFSLNDITRCLTQAEVNAAEECRQKGYSLSKIAKQCNLLGKVPALASYLGYTQDQVASLLGWECITTPEAYFKCIQRTNQSMRSLSTRFTVHSALPLSYLRESVPAPTLYLANEPQKLDKPTYTPYSTPYPHDYARQEHITRAFNRHFEICQGNYGTGGGTDYTPYSLDRFIPS